MKSAGMEMWEQKTESGSRPQRLMGGVDAPEVTPVPIPNTTVKGRTAEGTTLETMWENRWMPP